MEDFIYGKIEAQDIDRGSGTVNNVVLPDGSSVTLNQVGVQTFMDTFYNVRDFGAVADDATDCTAAFNSAFAIAGAVVWIPSGVYTFLSNLNAPACAVIMGAGSSTESNGTVLKPGSAVTKAFSLTTGGPNLLQDFIMDGTGTTGGVGMVLGDGAVWAGMVNRVLIQDFTGSNAIGLHVGDALKSTLIDVVVSGCTVNELWQGISSTALPTTIVQIGGVIQTASTKGLKLVTGYGSKFIGVDFESNTQEGTYIDTSVSGDVLDVDFDNCWWEANNGNSASNYEFNANGDNGRTIRFSIRGGYFNPTGSTKSILCDGTSGAVEVQFGNIDTPNAAATIRMQNGAYGSYVPFPRYLTYATVVSDPSSNLVAIENLYSVQITSNLLSAWTAYVPVYASDLGNQATTYSGSVTTSLARYKLNGKSLMIQVDFNGTLNAVTPAYLTVTLPAGLSGFSGQALGACIVVNNGIDAAGQARLDGATNIRFYRLPTIPSATLYTSASVVGGNVTFELETQ